MNNDEQLKQLGYNIRKWRELKDIKQPDLAKPLGKDKSWVSAVENGKLDISFLQLNEIANVLDVNPGVLCNDFSTILNITQSNNKAANVYGNNNSSSEDLIDLVKQILENLKK